VTHTRNTRPRARLPACLQVTEVELKMAKMNMEGDFRRNQLRPGDPGYEYDKQIEFAPAVEKNEWDDSSDEAAEEELVVGGGGLVTVGEGDGEGRCGEAGPVGRAITHKRLRRIHA
jgi:hypothetical protein